MVKLAAFLMDETGATAAEYALIIALVGGGLIIGLTSLSGAITGLFATVNGTISH